MSDDIETVRKFMRIACAPVSAHPSTNSNAVAAFDRIASENIAMKREIIRIELDRDSLRAKLERAKEALIASRKHVMSQNAAEGLLEGFGPRKPRPSDDTLSMVDAVLSELSADAPAQQTPSKPFDEWTDAETLAELEKIAPAQQTQISDEAVE